MIAGKKLPVGKAWSGERIKTGDFRPITGPAYCLPAFRITCDGWLGAYLKFSRGGQVGLGCTPESLLVPCVGDQDFACLSRAIFVGSVECSKPVV